MSTSQFNVRLPDDVIDDINYLAKRYGSQSKAMMVAISKLTAEIKLKENPKMVYTINYNTGVGNQEFDGDLFDAMNKADEGATYTQQSITIEDASGNEVTRRSWVGVLSDIENCENPIQFGDYGYYDDWQEI